MTTTNGNTTGIDPKAIATEIRLGALARENVQTKGRRYLIEGRLSVRHVNSDRIVAYCRGSEEFHKCGYERGGWYCTCSAKGHCSHLVALMLVTQRPGDNATPPGGWSA